MSFIVLETPFKTTTITLANGQEYTIEAHENLAYARACMRDCLFRGEAVFASHALFTQEGVLDDNDPDERMRGIEAGFEIAKHAKKRVFYLDRGITSGMRLGLVNATALGQVCEVRMLGGDWDIGWARELSVTALVDRLR